MSETIQTVFGLLGGLAIFIYGMNMMSDYLQKVAGQRMKRVLEVLTKNAFLGVIAGALCTAVLQSSSATTVMAIGFVSAGLMSRRQAVSVILGANIGTTITAQIIAFKITDYVLVFIFVGFVIYFLGRKDTIKNLGMTILAFGLLFLGIETMGDAMKPLASSPFFLDLISSVADNRVLGVLTGAFMTLVVQSSSATIAVLQNFASTPLADGVTSVMGLPGALPILLGDNIGTTITALLASIGQSREAKRVAVCHCLFNISGAILFIWFINPYASLITYLSPTGPEVEVISRQIANAHTGFNVIMTCIWLPLIGVLCKLSCLIVRDKKSKDSDGIDVIERLSNPVFLDTGSLGQPALALQLIAQESVRAGRVLSDGICHSATSLADKDKQLTKRANSEIEASLMLIHKINTYQVEMYSKGSLNEDQAAHTAKLICVLSDLERIGLLAQDMSGMIKEEELAKNGVIVAQLMSRICSMLSVAMDVVEGQTEDYSQLKLAKEELLKEGMKIRMDHIMNASQNKGGKANRQVLNDIVHNVDRMGNSCINIAETASEQVPINYFLSLDAGQLEQQEGAVK